MAPSVRNATFDSSTWRPPTIRGLALCKTRACLHCRPGLHPEHPTAVGGLPASKPGLDAGAHDLMVRLHNGRRHLNPGPVPGRDARNVA